MRGGSTVAATDWISVMDDASLPEGACSPRTPGAQRGDGAGRRNGPRGLRCLRAHGWPDLRRLARCRVITCPCHDWRFDVRTGEFLDAPEVRLAVYPCVARTASCSSIWAEREDNEFLRLAGLTVLLVVGVVLAGLGPKEEAVGRTRLMKVARVV